MRLVRHVARSYRGRGLPWDDLIGEGQIGLLEAARRYDPRRRVPFVSYATWWIRKHMLSALARLAVQTSVPSYGEAPRAGRSAPGVGALPRARTRLVSLEQILAAQGDRPLAAPPATADRATPVDDLLQEDLAAALRSALRRLPRHYRFILEAHYGLGGHPPRKLREIGSTLDLTRERVRQVESRAIERLRRLLKAAPPRRRRRRA